MVSQKPARLIPWEVLKTRVPFTRQHLGRLEKVDLFPKRIQVGGQRVAWLESEVDAWIMARAAEREAA